MWFMIMFVRRARFFSRRNFTLLEKNKCILLKAYFNFVVNLKFAKNKPKQKQPTNNTHNFNSFCEFSFEIKKKKKRERALLRNRQSYYIYLSFNNK